MPLTAQNQLGEPSVVCGGSSNRSYEAYSLFCNPQRGPTGARYAIDALTYTASADSFTNAALMGGSVTGCQSRWVSEPPREARHADDVGNGDVTPA